MYSSNKLGDGRRGIVGTIVGYVLAIPRLLLLLPVRTAWKWSGMLLAVAVESWKHRQLKHLLFGLPAAAVTGYCLYLLITIQATEEPYEVYAKAGQQALSAERWDEARLFLQRAVESGDGRLDTRFDLAKAAQGAGDAALMTTVLRELSPEDRPIHLPAHLWRATGLLSNPDATAEDFDAAETQLKLAIQLDQEHDVANGILGDLYFQKGQFSLARERLERCQIEEPRYKLQLADCLLRDGEKALARAQLESAIRTASGKVNREPADARSRIVWAKALSRMDRLDEAARILREGLALAKDPLLEQALASLYLTTADWLEEQPGDPLKKARAAFQMVAAALQLNPDDPKLFARLMNLVDADSSVAEEVEELMLGNLEQGIAVGLSHFVLGTMKMQERTDGSFHLEQAFELMPTAPVVANNLAWHLAHSENPDLDRALAMIDRVVEQTAGAPAYLETRGHILLKRKQWSLALVDLQKALPVFRDFSVTHEALAEAYENLGQPELAKRHRTRSVELRQQEKVRQLRPLE